MKLLQPSNGYDVKFEGAEDLDLWLRLAEIGNIANLHQCVVQYRLHTSSISASQRNRQMANAKLACSRAWERRGIAGQFTATDHWRAGDDKLSRHKFALQYGWVAWGHGYSRTWWTYVREAFRLRPFAISTWQLFLCGFFKKRANN